MFLLLQKPWNISYNHTLHISHIEPTSSELCVRYTISLDNRVVWIN